MMGRWTSLVFYPAVQILELGHFKFFEDFCPFFQLDFTFDQEYDKFASVMYDDGVFCEVPA